MKICAVREGKDTHGDGKKRKTSCFSGCNTSRQQVNGERYRGPFPSRGKEHWPQGKKK